MCYTALEKEKTMKFGKFSSLKLAGARVKAARGGKKVGLAATVG